MADDAITQLFESIEAEPAPEFTDALFARLRAELTAGPTSTPTDPDAGSDPGRDYVQTIETRSTRAPEHHDRHRRARWLAWAAAGVAAALVAGAAVAVTRGGDDGTVTMDVTNPEKSAEWTGTGAGGQLFSDGANVWVGVGATLQRIGADGQPDGTEVALPSPTEDPGAPTNSSVLGERFVVPGSPPVLVEPVAGATAQPLPALPSGTADGQGAAWTTDGSSRLWAAGEPGVVNSVDPATGEVTGSFTVPGVSGEVSMSYAAGSLWICYNDPSPALVRVDPDSGTVLASFPAFTFTVADGGDSVWYADYDTGDAVRLDPATNTEVARVPVAGTRLWGVYAIGGSIWASAYGAGRVDVINPGTNAVIASVKGIPNPTQVMAAGGRVYVRSTGTLVQVDPAP